MNYKQIWQTPNLSTNQDVYSALTSLDPTKSSGTDGIGPKLLKVGAFALYIYTSPPFIQVMFVQMLNSIRMEDSSHYSHI